MEDTEDRRIKVAKNSLIFILLRGGLCHPSPETGVLEKTLESPLDCKGIKPVHPKGNQL